MARTGRPSSYKPEYCEMLVEHMATGRAFRSFCVDIGVTHETLYQWTRKHPDFADAKKKGEEACYKFWESMGIHGMAGKVKNFNTAAWIFNMKNRFQWRDRTPDEIKEDVRPLVIVKPSTGEREILTNTRAVEQLDVGKSEEDEE